MSRPAAGQRESSQKHPEHARFEVLLGMLTIASMVDAGGAVGAGLSRGGAQEGRLRKAGYPLDVGREKMEGEEKASRIGCVQQDCKGRTNSFNFFFSLS